MPTRPYDLPSLTMLSAFEAAARRVSLKDAARELNITPGAVSRQVKALETELGVELFNRVHRGVELTPEGRELSSVLAQGFAQAAKVCRRLRTIGATPTLTIGTTTAVASLWLMPKIGAFWREHPDITLNHVISDEPAEMRRSDIDLCIRYGDGSWSGEASLRLFGDRLFPVCGAAFAGAHWGAKPEDLPSLPLLRMARPDLGWPDWEEWFAWTGISHGPLSGRVFNNHTIVLQAAQDDQGVALAWERLAAPMLERGELVRFMDLGFEAPGAYYLTWVEDRPPAGAMALFRDWLLSLNLD